MPAKYTVMSETRYQPKISNHHGAFKRYSKSPSGFQVPPRTKFHSSIGSRSGSPSPSFERGLENQPKYRGNYESSRKYQSSPREIPGFKKSYSPSGSRSKSGSPFSERDIEDRIYSRKFQKEFPEYVEQKSSKYSWKQFYEKRVERKREKQAKKEKKLEDEKVTKRQAAKIMEKSKMEEEDSDEEVVDEEFEKWYQEEFGV